MNEDVKRMEAAGHLGAYVALVAGAEAAFAAGVAADWCQERGYSKAAAFWLNEAAYLRKWEAGEEVVLECPSCRTFTVCEFGPDPYASDIHDDYSCVWKCSSCRWESAQDI